MHGTMKIKSYQCVYLICHTAQTKDWCVLSSVFELRYFEIHGTVSILRW